MQRLSQLQQWLESLSKNTYTHLQSASADASFRHYYRANNTKDNKTYVIMDAPPDKEDCSAFIQVTDLIRQAGVNAPNIIAMNKQQGFLLLDDLGHTPYLDKLNSKTADALYSDAINALVKMQRIDAKLPAYDKNLLQAELNLFETWYINRHLGVQLNTRQKLLLSSTFELLINSAIEQPQVFVHRDYHSRNLMLVDNNNPGVIDYQDAVIGPISYDLASLFKDCYIEWPIDKVEDWLDLYLARLPPENIIEKQTFIRCFDLIGVQRHLKILGIFSRLHYRDAKAQYLNDLPLTLKYITDSCERYEELQALKQLLKQLPEENIAHTVTGINQ